jgi:hypothetical protein
MSDGKPQPEPEEIGTTVAASSQREADSNQEFAKAHLARFEDEVERSPADKF